MLENKELEAYEKDARLECIRVTGRRPAKVAVNEIDDETVELVVELPPASIARTRRITGYLSEQANWNGAKKAELKDRKLHVCLKPV